MGLDLTKYDEVLKINYEGPIREQLQQNQVLLAHIRKDVSKSTFRGKQSLIPVHTGRNIGRGARKESGTLPSAGNQDHENAIYNMSYLYGRVSITGPTIAASKDNAGSFARAVDNEMRGLAKDLAKEQNRQLWHDGSGMLTAIQTTEAASQTILSVYGTKFCEVGMPVEVRNIADGALLSSTIETTITAVSKAAKTITISTALAAQATAPTAAVYMGYSRDTTALPATTASDWTQPLEMWGLEAIVSDEDPAETWWNGTTAATQDGFTTTNGANGRIGGLASTVSTWAANIVESNDTWTNNLTSMQQAYDESEIEGEVTPGLCLTSHAMRRAMANVLTPDRRYGNESELKSGWTGIKFNNCVVLADRDATNAYTAINDDALIFNSMYFISPSSLEFHCLEDLAWEDTGGILVRAGVGSAGIDEYEAFMKQYANLICTRRNANTLYRGDPT